MLANKRCVIPAEGFYEWREEHGKKQPYFFARKDGKPVMRSGGIILRGPLILLSFLSLQELCPYLCLYQTSQRSQLP
jgi:hypothetical protein